jgi:hypothetical protein
VWRWPHAITLVLVGLGFVFCAWSVVLDRPSLSYAHDDTPIAIAVAFDLSPSMLAIPDPAFDGNIQPRYVRARTALLELFRILEERQQNMVVALVAYTKNAEVLMGWDHSASQLREIIEYGLSPGIHTTTGTSMEAAVGTVIDLFRMLPVELRDTSNKLAVFVSDGEDTLPQSFLGYAIEELGSQSFDVVALHTGLLDTNEGVPRYGEVGEFLGFEAMGGKLHTVPDAEAMDAIAHATIGRGLYVRAEDPLAAEKMLQFTVNVQTVDAYLENRAIAILGMFFVVLLLCARVLR